MTGEVAPAVDRCDSSSLRVHLQGRQRRRPPPHIAGGNQ